MIAPHPRKDLRGCGFYIKNAEKKLCRFAKRSGIIFKKISENFFKIVIKKLKIMTSAFSRSQTEGLKLYEQNPRTGTGFMQV